MLKFILLLIIVLLITSCSENDDVEGVWILDSFDLSSCPEDIPNTTLQAVDGCISFQGERICFSFTLTEDGMLESSVQYDNGPADIGLGSYTINDDIMTFCFDGDCQDLEYSNQSLILEDSIEGCRAKFVFRKN